MKTKQIIILILFINISVKGQTTGPFNYKSYVHYDAFLSETGINIPYPDLNYRSNQETFGAQPKADIFYYACNRQTKELSKPFIFVEGISFDKASVTQTEYTYEDYFEQGINLSNNGEIFTDNPILCSMMTTNHPGFNPTVGNSTFNWATLVTGVDAEGVAYGDPLRVEKSPELLNKLICAGFDIVFIDFLSGEQYIENNGEALYSALAKIKQLMVENGSTEKMAVCGASMGGLVARYAVKKHELAGHTDWFSHFISFDSPQEGANINLALQYTLKHLRYFPVLGDEPRNIFKKVTCPSASQLVRYSCLSGAVEPSVFTTTPGPNQERLTLLSNPLISSWPNSCKLVSITNGSRNGTPQYGSQNTGNLPVFNSNGVIDIDLNTLPYNQTVPVKIVDIHIVNACQWLNSFNFLGLLSKQVFLSNSLPLDGLAGSYRRDIEDFANQMPRWLGVSGALSIPACNFINMNDWIHNTIVPTNICFIPLLSSAGIINFESSVTSPVNVMQALFQGKEKFEDPQHTVSHFDVVYAPIDNQTHVEITDENIEWVMTELVAQKNIAFQNETIPNGTYLARETIKAGWDVDKYGDQCGQMFQPAMHPQYSYSPNAIQTCGPVVTQTGTVVVLHAGNRIELHPGFSSTDAFYFEASILDGLGCGTQSGARYANESYAAGGSSNSLVAGLQPMLPLEDKKLGTDTEKITFVLAPNPTRGGVVLRSNSSEAKLIEIRDVQGRLLKRSESTLQDTNLDLTELPAGLYYVSSVGENHRFVSKVLKE